MQAPEDNPFEDYDWCRRNTACTSPHSSACVPDECSALARSEADVVPLPLGLVAVDDRVEAHPDRPAHPGVDMWAAFAARHNYTWIPRVAEVPPNASRCADRIMLKDWQSTRHVLAVLKDPAYAHLSHLAYVELDQWPVRPRAR